jgi:DNA-binding response OmpR family regulator
MSNYTLLLIDYEPRSIRQITEALEGAGYRIEVATDGRSGIETFQRIKPDLTLVEAMLPKKHGFEVCRELKKTAHGKTAPVLVITGVYRGRKYRTQAMHHYGADEYLEKPIADDALISAVRVFLKETDSPAAQEPSAAAHADGRSGSVDETEREILDSLDNLFGGDDKKHTRPRTPSVDPKLEV